MSTAAETFNPVIVDFYREVGYLPDAIINYLMLLGWSLDDKTEDFTREEMIEHFTLERVTKAPASFDPKKLWAFQDRYMQRLPVEARWRRCCRTCRGRTRRATAVRHRAEAARIIVTAGDRIKVGGDILEFPDFFTSDDALPVEGPDFDKIVKAEGAVALLRELAARLESVDSFEPAALEQEVKAFLAERNLKAGPARASCALRRYRPDRRPRALRRARDPRAASGRSRASAARRPPAPEVRELRRVPRQRADGRSRFAIAPELRQGRRAQCDAGDADDAAHTIERASPNCSAMKPARALPSNGPVMYESCSMLAIRPRNDGGIVSFQIVIRNRPLTMSAAPASTRQPTATGSEVAKPSPMIATPQSAAATITAAPRRSTLRVQPLKTVTSRAPMLMAE